jgi:hypothetical protein
LTMAADIAASFQLDQYDARLGAIKGGGSRIEDWRLVPACAAFRQALDARGKAAVW